MDDTATSCVVAIAVAAVVAQHLDSAAGVLQMVLTMLLLLLRVELLVLLIGGNVGAAATVVAVGVASRGRALAATRGEGAR